MTVAEMIKTKILAHLKQQQLAVDSLQHESARLEEENAFWKQKADEEEHIKKGRDDFDEKLWFIYPTIF